MPLAISLFIEFAGWLGGVKNMTKIMHQRVLNP